MKFSSIEQIVNDDIFLVLDRFECGRNIHLKLEGFNPGGSIKIKTALALVRDAELHRDLRAKRKMIESSSGNLGLSLSMIAAARGYAFTCVVDANTSPQAIGTMRALVYGTRHLPVSRLDGEPDQSQLDPRWSLPSQLARNPLAWLIEIDGLVVDARRIPRNLQEEAFRQGVIPFVPDEGQ